MKTIKLLFLVSIMGLSSLANASSCEETVETTLKFIKVAESIEYGDNAPLVRNINSVMEKIENGTICERGSTPGAIINLAALYSLCLVAQTEYPFVKWNAKKSDINRYIEASYEFGKLFPTSEDVDPARSFYCDLKLASVYWKDQL